MLAIVGCPALNCGDKRAAVEAVPSLLAAVVEAERAEDGVDLTDKAAMAEALGPADEGARRLAAAARALATAWAVDDGPGLPTGGSPAGKGVHFVTAHASKGLEWRAVVVSLDRFCAGDAPEERRLLFVAVTRAQRQLALVRTGRALARVEGRACFEVVAAADGPLPSPRAADARADASCVPGALPGEYSAAGGFVKASSLLNAGR